MCLSSYNSSMGSYSGWTIYDEARKTNGTHLKLVGLFPKKEKKKKGKVKKKKEERNAQTSLCKLIKLNAFK